MANETTTPNEADKRIAALETQLKMSEEATKEAIGKAAEAEAKAAALESAIKAAQSNQPQKAALEQFQYEGGIYRFKSDSFIVPVNGKPKQVTAAEAQKNEDVLDYLIAVNWSGLEKLKV